MNNNPDQPHPEVHPGRASDLRYPATMLRIRHLAAALGLAVAGIVIAGAAAPERKPAAQCFAPATWYKPSDTQPQPVPAADIYAAAAKSSIVILGEQHDDADHHRWQLQTLAALHALRPRMVIGFEAFPRRIQPVLDRWVAGELSIREFVEQAEWSKVWGFPVELYLPLFQFARMNRIPMVALNVERTLTQAIAERGWEAVPTAQREGVSKPAAPPENYREELFAVYREHPRGQRRKEDVTREDADFRNFVESQTVWDRAMAEALAKRATGTSAPLVVGIMGAGHVRNGHGVVHQLKDLGVTDATTLLPVSTSACAEVKPGIASAIFAVAPAKQDPAPPPRLGVTLADADKRVTLAQVNPGSLADASGLKAGDRIVEIGGRPATSSLVVISAVRLQPAGTWLPLKVERGSEMLDIVVRFPAEKK